MPKVITSKRLAGEAEKAHAYIKSHILFPSGILGLIFMISGMGSLAYQFMAESYDVNTFVASTGLFVSGGLLGWGATRYHRYILRKHPDYFAAKMKIHSRSRKHKPQREGSGPQLKHPGRRWVPLWYGTGIGVLLGLSFLAAQYGSLYYWAALLLPWAGFFWAKLFFWRGILKNA